MNQQYDLEEYSLDYTDYSISHIVYSLTFYEYNEFDKIEKGFLYINYSY